MGSLVGLTEERTRQALRIADAMAPCIVFVDEIEKGSPVVQASGQTDSGVSARRMFGTLLSYLNDHDERRRSSSARPTTYPSCRPSLHQSSSRFDAIFFLDLPGVAGRSGAGDLAALPRPVRARPGAAPPGRPGLHRRRDPGLLPARGPAGRPAGGGRSEHRSRGRDCERLGGTPPELGGRPMPVGGPARHLHPRLGRGCQPRQGGTQRPSQRPVGQLTPGLSSSCGRRSVIRTIRV